MISRKVLAPIGWQFAEKMTAAITHLLIRSAVFLGVLFDIGSWFQRLRSCAFLIWSRVCSCSSSSSSFPCWFSPSIAFVAHFSIALFSIVVCFSEPYFWSLISLKRATVCCSLLAASIITIPELQGPSGSHMVCNAIFPRVASCPWSGFVSMS